MPAGEAVDPPHSLKPTEECAVDEVVDLAGLQFAFFFFSIVCFSCEAISPCERFFLQYYIYYLQISHLLLFNEKFYSHVGQASKC